jgi:hypothetical protein
MNRDREEKGRTGIRLRIDPDSSPVSLHDLLANGQANAGSGVLSNSV